MTSKTVLDIENAPTLDNTEPNPSNAEHSIVNYLIEHPQFFQRHPQLLAKLEFEHHDNETNTVSLIQRQLAALRKENEHLEQQLTQLINTANTNEQLLQHTQQLILDIMQQTTLKALLNVLTNDVQQYFSIDSSNLILFSEHFAQHTDSSIDLNSAKEKIAGIIENPHVVCGTFRDHEIDFIFNNNHAHKNKIKSAAISPLYHHQHQLGIFALASYNAEHFQTGSDTDLIDFLSQAISIKLSQFIIE